MERELTVVPLGEEFFGSPIAHRGLHDCDGVFGTGRAENSFAAFEAAIERGYGIEIDVQLSADGVPVVFHDRSLKRLFKINKLVSDLPIDKLKQLLLTNRETIPTFDEFLEFISGKVPVLVELKDQNTFFDKNTVGIEDLIARSLRIYEGPVAVMSFNPYLVKKFGFKLPQIPRGLVTEAFKRSDWPELGKKKLKWLRSLSGVLETASSFISHDHLDLRSKYISQIPTSTRIFSWTIRDKRELALALKRSDNVTFEGFIP